MAHYTSITIIYNPISTGPSQTMAQEFAKELREVLPKQKVTLAPTQYAGHAEVLAYELATASHRALVISASGDGGYHEVVNGLMKAKQTGVDPTAGLLPAGNANDHFRNLHHGDTIKNIAAMQEKHIDLLKLAFRTKQKKLERYAHSYIGIGLTPKVGTELNKTKLNVFKEIWIVAKVLLFLKPVRVTVGGQKRSYDSLIFSNVSKMSKVLTVSEHAEVDDGKFEITAFRRRNKLKLITSLLHASTTGLAGSTQAHTYSFQPLKTILVQLDGEINTIDAGTTATVLLEPTALRCII